MRLSLALIRSFTTDNGMLVNYLISMHGARNTYFIRCLIISHEIKDLAGHVSPAIIKLVLPIEHAIT